MTSPIAEQSETIWTVNQRKFMEWVATPSELRMPLTEEKLADELRVGRTTLWRWKQLLGFKEEVNRLITESLSNNYHDVMYSFQREAAKGSFAHQRMYFEMMGLYVQKFAPTTPDGKHAYGSAPANDLIRDVDRILDAGRARKALAANGGIEPPLGDVGEE
jgi:hypothetical protein